MQVSRALGDFRIIREIGRGGMGVVYLAHQRSLGRQVALKVLPREFTADEQRRQRFRREAEAVSRLDHPSIVPVYAVGEEDGLHFIAMKFLDGENLDLLIKRRRPDAAEDRDELWNMSGDAKTLVLSRREGDSQQRRRRDGRVGPQATASGPLSGSEPGWVLTVIRILEKVARALHHAHTRGVIHRDVKPSNILIDEQGNPWLLDFGLVRDLHGETLTETRSILGTAYYMAPELIRRDRNHTDHRADIYALGVTLYEALTLRRPFEHQSPAALFNAIATEDPIPPRRRNSRLPRDLNTVILKAMSKEPGQRYQSAEALAEDLRRVRSFEPIVARPVTTIGRARKWVHRNQALAGAFLFGILSFLGMVEYSIYSSLQDERRARRALEVADQAFDEGNLQDALNQYNLYLMLGGDPDVVGPRLSAIRTVLQEASPREEDGR